MQKWQQFSAAGHLETGKAINTWYMFMSIRETIAKREKFHFYKSLEKPVVQRVDKTEREQLQLSDVEPVEYRYFTRD